MMWFRRKPEADEIALVEYGNSTFRVDVHRDADDRPYCVILDSAVRLDVPTDREIIWLKRRASTVEGKSHG